MKRFVNVSFLVIVTVYLFTLVFLSCTDDGSPDPENTPTPTATSTPTSTPTIPALNMPVIVSPLDGVFTSSHHPLIVIEDTNESVTGIMYSIQLSDQADFSNLLSVELCDGAEDGLIFYRFTYDLEPGKSYYYLCLAEAAGYGSSMTPVYQIRIEYIGDNNPNYYLCAGDSITEGEGNGIEYPVKLSEKLKVYFGSDAEAVNEGIGGLTAGRLYLYIGDFLEYHDPAYLILLVGINDLMYPDVCLEPYDCRTLEYIILISEASYYNDSIPVLCTLTPIISDSSFDGPIAELNKQIRQYCEANAIDLVDLHAAFMDYPGDLSDLYQADGRHPNDSGFEYLASVIYDYLIQRGANLD